MLMLRLFDSEQDPTIVHAILPTSVLVLSFGSVLLTSNVSSWGSNAAQEKKKKKKERKNNVLDTYRSYIITRLQSTI
jgi:hypothetical protein